MRHRGLGRRVRPVSVDPLRLVGDEAAILGTGAELALLGIGCVAFSSRKDGAIKVRTFESLLVEPIVPCLEAAGFQVVQ
jgi:hypothetical protein